MRKRELVEIACTIKRESDKAILVRVHNRLPPGEDEVWFPFSQVEEVHRDEHGTDDKLVVTAWIAQQKGL